MKNEDCELQEIRRRLDEAEAEGKKPEHLRKPREPGKPPSFIAPVSYFQGASPFGWLFGRP